MGRFSMVKCLPGSGKEVGISLKMRDLFWVSGMVGGGGGGVYRWDEIVWFVVGSGKVLGGSGRMAGVVGLYIY